MKTQLHRLGFLESKRSWHSGLTRNQSGLTGKILLLLRGTNLGQVGTLSLLALLERASCRGEKNGL
jgi:hypothetical protein